MLMVKVCLNSKRDLVQDQSVEMDLEPNELQIRDINDRNVPTGEEKALRR